MSASSRFEKTTMPSPREEENKRRRIKEIEEEEVGASGSLRSLVIFITRKRLTFLFVPPSISPTNLCPCSIFKLTGHSNKFSLFSRHYKYNLEREYSRSRILLIVLSCPLCDEGKLWRKNSKVSLSLSRSYRARFRFPPISIGHGISIEGILVSFRFHFRPSFRKSAFSSCISYRLGPPINRCRDSRPQRESSITNLFSGRWCNIARREKVRERFARHRSSICEFQKKKKKGKEKKLFGGNDSKITYRRRKHDNCKACWINR